MAMVRYTRLFSTLLPALLLTGTLMTAQADVRQAQIFYDQAFAAHNRGHEAEALRLFKAATQEDPGYTNAFFNLGTLQYQTGDYAGAKESFSKVLTLSPTDIQARYNLALAQERLKELNGAIQTLSAIPAGDSQYERAQQKIASLELLIQNGKASKPEPAKPDTATNAGGKIIPIQPIKLSSSDKAVANGTTSEKPAVKKPVVQTFVKGFAGPTGLTLGPDGALYIANYSKNSIEKVDAKGARTTFAQGGLSGPVGLIWDSAGRQFFVANYLQNSVSRITPDGKITTLASGLNKPYILHLDAAKKVLYVSEQETNSISKIMLP
jgi:tetratricopeptide (TPR) repeat protein